MSLVRSILSILIILSFGFLTINCTTNKSAESVDEKAASKTHEPNLTLTAATHQKSLVSDLSYNLQFNLPEKSANYSGISEIRFKYKAGVRTPFRIDFFEGKITHLSVNGKELPPDYDNFVLMIPASTLVDGSNVISIGFERAYSRNGSGLVKFEDPEDQRVYTYTDLEPYDANRVFPCLDQPDLKASYTMSVTAPKSWQVITSIRESVIKELTPETNLWSFPESARFSTYIWSLHAGPFQVWTDMAGDIPLRLFARQSLAKYVQPKEWFTYTRQGFEFFNKYFDYSYPYLKYDQLIVPEFNAGAMENVAAVTFTERFISRGPKSDRDRRGMANTILHEMAHMWFGDLVTMKWWNDLWLNESFATYMAHLALYENTEFKDSAWRAFNGTKGWAYWEDQLVTTHPIEADVPDTRQAFANFDGITYGKGASVLKQIAFFIGPDKFQAGVQAYFKKYAHQNTELKDFMGSLSQAYGSSLEQWQKQWLQTASLNTLSVKLQCDKDKITNLSLEQSAPADFPTIRSHRFKVALFGQRGSSLEVSETYTVRMTEKSFPLIEAQGRPCPTLVYPNYDDYGYFKVNLDPQTVAQLPKAIHQITSPFERQMFWVALWDMVRDSHLDLRTFANLALTGIEKENDPEALHEILGYLHGRHSNSASVVYYMPTETPVEKRTQTAFAERLEQTVWKKLLDAKANSELQKIWLDSLERSGQTSFGLSNLKALLDGDVKLKGLPIDQDKRWSIIQRLASFNYAQPLKLIEREFAKDSTATGKNGMIASKAAIPSWETKQEWLIELLKKDSPYSFDQLKMAIWNLFPHNQVSLRERYAPDFYKNLSIIAKERDGAYARTFAVLVPSECEAQNGARISEFIAKNPDLHPLILKSLKVARQEDDRCRHIRALVRSQSVVK